METGATCYEETVWRAARQRASGDAPEGVARHAARHAASMRELAALVGRPLAEIAEVYEGELARLAAGAAVSDFLPVLVAKRVRALYRHRTQAMDTAEPCAALACASPGPPH